MMSGLKKRISELIDRRRRNKYMSAVRARAAAAGEALRVNYPSSVTGSTYLGNHVNFNGMVIKGRGKVVIGNWFHSGQDCLMITSFHNYDGGSEIPYDDTTIDKDIIIGDCVWLGDRVIVLGGARIGEGAVIQAGSVVVGEIPPFSVAGGHPAAVFKKRDVKHYEELKKEGRFH